MRRAFAVIAFLWPILEMGVTPAVAAPGMPTCIDSLQQQIDAVPDFGTLLVRTDCVYREEVTISRPITLDGQGAAEIRGSDVWTDWWPQDGTWISGLSVPSFPTHGTCSKQSDDRCRWAEQVFFNGTSLRQVAAGTIPQAGEFSLTDSRQVVIADDPNGALIEVTTRRHWMSIEADSVTIQGLRMQHAAADAQDGGLVVEGVSGWAIRDSVFSDAHGRNVSFARARGGQMVGNDIFNAGQLGFGGQSDDTVIQGNLVRANNTEGFSSAWEAGGTKISRSRNVMVTGNAFEMNSGPGIWCDIDCSNVTIADNVVHHNLGVGIAFEISDGAEIAGNRVWENGWGSAQRPWAYEAGILVASSSNAHVHHNVVAWNGDGIAVISQCRAHLADGRTCDLAHPWNAVRGNTVHDNAIIMADDPMAPYNVFPLAWARDIEDAAGSAYRFMFSPEAGNEGYDNRYWLPQPEGSTKIGFSWGDSNTASLSAFNVTPGEERGTYLSDTERDQILTGAGMPMAPERHDAPVESYPPMPPG